jgi:hypothetical protein
MAAFWARRVSSSFARERKETERKEKTERKEGRKKEVMQPFGAARSMYCAVWMITPQGSSKLWQE